MAEPSTMLRATPCLGACLSQRVIRSTCLCVGTSVLRLYTMCTVHGCPRVHPARRAKFQSISNEQCAQTARNTSKLLLPNSTPDGRRPHMPFSSNARCSGGRSVAGPVEVHVMAVSVNPRLPWVPGGAVVYGDDDGGCATATLCKHTCPSCSPLTCGSQRLPGRAPDSTAQRRCCWRCRRGCSRACAGKTPTSQAQRRSGRSARKAAAPTTLPVCSSQHETRRV